MHSPCGPQYLHMGTELPKILLNIYPALIVLGLFNKKWFRLLGRLHVRTSAAVLQKQCVNT